MPRHDASPNRTPDIPTETNRRLRQARSAQRWWARRTVKDRVRALKPVVGHLAGEADAIAAAISRANGKPRIDALATEVMPAIMAARYYLKRAHRFLRPTWVAPGSAILLNKWSRIQRLPYGVVGIISPWNYPFAIPFSEVLMALLAGNAVVVKTATISGQAGRRLERCFETADLPPGLFTALHQPGAVVGPALLEAGIDKLFFTGSVAVGKELMARAAPSLTPLVLELGGNDAMLVCADADPERAASGAVWAGFQNAGQSCGGVERIYVHQAIYDPFMERLKEKVAKLRVGIDTGHDVDVGPLTTSAQKEVVLHHLEDALAKGAVIHAQAQAPTPAPGEEDRFVPPTVLSETNHEMLVMREETFGPVVAVMRVEDMDRAVEQANDSIYGLTASIWSRDRRRAGRLAGRLQAGVVTINDHLMSHGMPETPWGGWKMSGIGRTHGRLGFDEMVRSQVNVFDLLDRTRRNLWWHPYDPRLYRGLRSVIHLCYGPGPIHRLRALWPAARILPRIFRPW